MGTPCILSNAGPRAARAAMANSTFGPRGIFRNVSPFLPSAWFYTFYRILVAGTDERKSPTCWNVNWRKQA